jgi:uncharacterized protein YutE (UPF0331/DUF86 family)
MVDANVISMKLAELSSRVARIRTHCPATTQELAADLDMLDLVSFNLLLVVQTCLDLASHLISDEGWAPAATAREALERLEEQGVISRQTLRSLQRAVGLRNVVAHGYSGADPAQIHTAAHLGLSDLEQFSREISAWVEGRIGTGD